MESQPKTLEDQIYAIVGKEYGPYYGWDTVNAPMIRHWCEAMGDINPIYTNSDAQKPALSGTEGSAGVVSPPTMLQAWVMKGYDEKFPEGSDERSCYEMLEILGDAGFFGVVAVNCEQTYERYLKEGENLYSITTVDSISERKNTPLGEGYFVTTVDRYYSMASSDRKRSKKDEYVGSMMFRVLRFKPSDKKPSLERQPSTSGPRDKALRPRPGINYDNRFFWDGLKNKELLIQKCRGCKELRHPPGPMCPSCRSLEWEALKSKGRGYIYSFVNMHHPQIPPFDSPNPIALVELDEGTRLVAGVQDITPTDMKIGMRVMVEFVEDGDMVFALFKPEK